MQAALRFEHFLVEVAIELQPLTRISVTVLAALIIILGVFPAPVLGQLKGPSTPAAAHVAAR